MSKNIVICSDGTWNTPQQEDRGLNIPTNVVKIARAVDLSDKSPHQRRFYYKGVGTQRWERLQGGAFGRGLSENVRKAYNDLVNVYDQGDKVFFFGFSRGAYTVRSLSGFINYCGLLRKGDIRETKKAYEAYRTKNKELADAFKAKSRPCEIEMIGVWDTVKAMGIPLRALNWITRKSHDFHDHSLTPCVRHGYQALAIDEQRAAFAPVEWNPPGSNQTVEQVWFAGVHSNIGGGYIDSGLSDVALEWMIGKAESHGLVIDEDYQERRIAPRYRGFLRDSRPGVSKAWYWKGVRKIPPGVKLHASVGERVRDQTVYYSPENLGRLEDYNLVD